MDFREIGWEGVDWICLPQDRDQWQVLVNAVMNVLRPQLEMLMNVRVL
jgi:hypothetical protein